MANSEATAPRERVRWRRTKAVARICWRLFIWLAAAQAVWLGWWSCAVLFLIFAFSAYLCQLVQDPLVWSARWRAFPRAFGTAFGHANAIEATVNLALTIVVLGTAVWSVLKIWNVDLSWFLGWYGLATSIQCMHWRRLSANEDVYWPIPIFLTLLRDLVSTFPALRRRNRHWTDHYPLRRNDSAMDSARRDAANAGQGSEHLQ